MGNYRITIKQLSNNEITLEDIRDIFLELRIKNTNDFNEIKKSGDLKIPSFDNINALCKSQKGKSFEVFFFGNTELNLKIEQKLIDSEFIIEIKKWCVDNDIITLNDYRFPKTKRPIHFPTYKATVNNYGEEYFYDVIGLQRRKTDFHNKLFDESFINTLREWCIENKVHSKNEYLNKKPRDFPLLETIRQLTGKNDYFKEL